MFENYVSKISLRPRQSDHHFAGDIFKCIFLNKNVQILSKIWVKFVPKVRIVPFHEDLSPSGEQLEHRKLGHEL